MIGPRVSELSCNASPKRARFTSFQVHGARETQRRGSKRRKCRRPRRTRKRLSTNTRQRNQNGVWCSPNETLRKKHLALRICFAESIRCFPPLQQVAPGQSHRPNSPRLSWLDCFGLDMISSLGWHAAPRFSPELCGKHPSPRAHRAVECQCLAAPSCI